MYRPNIKLNTRICEVCRREFCNEKAMKDHIFNRRVNDNNHILLKEKIRNARFDGANLECPVCNQRFFRSIGKHFSDAKDKKHHDFLIRQDRIILLRFLEGNSILDIAHGYDIYTKDFSEKYILNRLVKIFGKKRYSLLSKKILSNKHKNYWKNISLEQRKKIMGNARFAQWGNLDKTARKRHPWVIAGKKASLESCIKGSKNQKHAYTLLKEKFTDSNWEYNYVIFDDWHIDIACPDKRIFIEWDGRHHRIPIHGESYLINRKNRDYIKNKLVTNKLNGLLIRVKDDGREDLNFVNEKVEEIIRIINSRTKKGVVCI